MIDAAELLGVGMDVDERLPRVGDVEQRVALRRHFRHAAADQQHEIGRLDARFQLRIGADADIAGISSDAVGRTASRGGTRPPTGSCEALGEPAQSATRLRRPARRRRE